MIIEQSASVCESVPTNSERYCLPERKVSVGMARVL